MRAGACLRRWAAAAALLAAAALPGHARAQEAPLSGVIHVVWDTEPDALRPAAARFYLVQPDGRAVEILPGAAGAAGVDGLLARDRRQVEVIGVAVPGAAGAPAVVRASAVREVGPARSWGPAASVAAWDFVTVLCRFADDPSTPFTPGAVETVHGSSYPGVRHFYQELSRDAGIMSGSTVVGWYTLPEPRSTYIGASTNHGALVRDCTAAADADVDFGDFYGINVQVNGFLSTRPTPPYDPLSFGGSWTLDLDGESRVWGVTWLSGEHHDNYVVVTHELGHALGWPHSSGEYGNEYDSQWDVMSVGYLRFEQPWGWLTIHTIAHHKRLAGWIPSDRRWIVPSGTRETATIVRSALPPAAGHLMAEIPLEGGASYTVEARYLAGHDQPLPAEAIVIHRTQGSRAYVVDPDLNGDPNDEGAIWRPGETFVDAARDIRITVEQAVADGFVVTVDHASVEDCLVEVVAEPAGGGTVAVTGGGASGACGRSVTVTATPGDGWGFERWTDGGIEVSTTASYGFVANASRTLTAHFAQVPQCTVAVTAEPAEGGTVAVTGGGADGACGRSVTVTATAGEGWAFERWREGTVELSTSASYELVLSTSRDLTAQFTQVPQCTIAVTAEPAEGGTVAVTNGGASGACGRSVTLTATPGQGWVFLRWAEGGLDVATASAVEAVLDEDRAWVAHFVSAGDLAGRAIAAMFGPDAPLAPAERALLDREGNDNGVLDLGDVLAFLDAHPGAAPGGIR